MSTLLELSLVAVACFGKMTSWRALSSKRASHTGDMCFAAGFGFLWMWAFAIFHGISCLKIYTKTSELQGSLTFDMQLAIARRITKVDEAQELGAKLNVTPHDIQRATEDNRNDVLGATTIILNYWRRTMSTDKQAFTEMHRALRAMRRVDVITEVLKVASRWRALFGGWVKVNTRFRMKYGMGFQDGCPRDQTNCLWRCCRLCAVKSKILWPKQFELFALNVQKFNLTNSLFCIIIDTNKFNESQRIQMWNIF